MVNPNLIWTILLAPLVACLVIVFLTLRSKALSAMVAIAGILISFTATIMVASHVLGTHHSVVFEQSIPWITLNNLTINIGYLINPLAVMMLLVVTGVGSAIFIYSRGYMSEDASQSRFFAYLSLFAFSMIGIVLSNNLIQLFIFWELVGLSSYLLIGFWYHKPSAADAGVKAFLCNRLADFGFLCGILLLWSLSGVGTERSFDFTTLATVVKNIDPAALHIAALLIFCGVVGKSAQVPLHVWLADAMEGPTPVSALIHAATMVAAGIYLLARTFFIFELTPDALTIIAYIGGITAFLAATMAVVENDIKRILAYSTLSQLGLMVLAVGLAGPMQGMYHLTTHAFFKALLFLGAGSVIYAMHHEQNIWKMNGLLKQMPITGFTFLIGTLALCGIFPLSGFFSKDEILTLASEHNTFLYILASVTSGLTSFYMGRLFFVAFWGNPAKSKHHHDHPVHESPIIMTLPLILLAILSAVGGFLGLSHLIYPEASHEPINMRIAIISTVVAISGLSLAYMIYGKRSEHDPLEKTIKLVYPILKNKYYFDAFYSWYVREIQQSVAKFVSKIEEIVIKDFGVGLVTGTSQTTGQLLRHAQNGLVQRYALIFILGVIILFLVMVTTL